MSNILTLIKPPLTDSELPLRDYQKSMVKEILGLYARGVKRNLVQLPTGGGKSLIITGVVADALDKGERVMLVAHKTELINQLADHVNRWLKADYAIIANKSRYKRDYSKQVQISSPQALNYLNFADLDDFDLIVIDEAHHSHARSYARIFEYYHQARFLGVTATPARIDGTGLRTLFNSVDGYEKLISGISVGELVEKGYLCPFKLFANPLLDSSERKIKTTAGDFNKKDLEKYCLEADISGDLVENYRKYADGKRCVVYPASVKLSQEYCQKFNDEGISAEHISAKTPHKEREKILADFRQGKIKVLCQHSIVLEGVDIPDIEAVLFARPTKSLIIWFQAIGRALRIAEGKTHAIIIDLTDNFRRLPLPITQIEWSLDAKPVTPTEPAHHCQECNHYFQPTKYDYQRGWGHCPHCRAKYQLEAKKEPLGAGEKKPLTHDLEAELTEINISNLAKDWKFTQSEEKVVPQSESQKKIKLKKNCRLCGSQQGFIFPSGNSIHSAKAICAECGMFHKWIGKVDFERAKRLNLISS